ncbi:MAG: DUF2207 domain-containing protein [Salinibacterium sp.]|nr:DUF2207 domain-containing protein [Salinibacterium sp.]
MKPAIGISRPALFLVALGIALLPVIAGGTAASAAPPVPAVPVMPAAATVSCDQGNDNDFAFQSFDADYYLGVDENGRSTLTTVETFVAVFPAIDQNQGMRRAIPLKYQGAPTDITVDSVTDGDGNPRAVETAEDDNGEFLLVTSRAPTCVHGVQTYVFTYTQHNVTRFFADTNDDEFYWDTNGTGFYQSFGSVTARVHVAASLVPSLTGGAACYQGYDGSTDRCDIQRADDGGGVVFSSSVTELQPTQNMTMVVAFEPHTFVPRDDSYLGSPLSFLQILAGAGSVIAAIWAGVLRRTALADGRGRPTIIAEYSPPAGLDPFTASVILKKTTRGAAATFVDLAVRRAIKIIEQPATGWFARGNKYVLQLVDASALTGPELSLARALFGGRLEPGTEYLMDGKDAKLSERVRRIIQGATSAAVSSGLRRKVSGRYAVLPTLLVMGAGTASAVLGFTMLDGSVGGILPIGLLAVPAIAVLVVFRLVFRTPLTEQGAELRDHLLGLELYIRLAEADRLQMLQSPEGAEKQGDVVKIYEKLLPYAVLFNLEKQWAIELGKYYLDQNPDYYSGTGTFNAGLFAASIGSLSSTAASSYSGSSSSSSSGGSGGGGSSGGGGGGGGGGGV